jgi:hypothetical protein
MRTRWAKHVEEWGERELIKDIGGKARREESTKEAWTLVGG